MCRLIGAVDVCVEFVLGILFVKVLVNSMALKPYQGILCARYIDFYSLRIIYINFISPKSWKSAVSEYYM
jgi:hypothetical protein